MFSRDGSVFKSKPKPRFFEETELELKPTFWPPFASVFLVTRCWQARAHLSTTKNIINLCKKRVLCAVVQYLVYKRQLLLPEINCIETFSLLKHKI